MPFDPMGALPRLRLGRTPTGQRRAFAARKGLGRDAMDVLSLR